VSAYANKTLVLRSAARDAAQAELIAAMRDDLTALRDRLNEYLA
jgi:hypothetical protein